MPLATGTRLGNYEVLAPLGAGGMGEVYRARDVRLGREVALKVLPAYVAADQDRLARLEREARTVAGLNHPNIVTLFSIEDDSDVRFITMELIDGLSLTSLVVPGGIEFERVAELGIALAEALAAAHDQGVVHRDLKPANVMLTRDGRVKILDFGLAKLEEQDVGTDLTQAPTIAPPLSSAGQVIGTLPYMAPEQVRGETVDPRTDLFALGVMLYELAAGRRPFDGGTPGVLSSAILRDTPASLTSLREDLPSDLDRIVSRCLEKDPRARIQTARDVANELRRIRPGRDAASFLKPPPTPATPLLGREELLDSAVRRVHAGARLLSVTGYGGTGKTRFAVELFRRLSSGYAAGAAFVSLASITAAAEVMTTVAGALDIGEAHGRSPLEALCSVIGQRPMLLVLDNLEQVLDAAEDIATLVARCPALQVIATSRAPLKVGAESEFGCLRSSCLLPTRRHSTRWQRVRPSFCSSSAPRRRSRASRSTPRTPQRSPPSAAASTACLSLSNWPLRVSHSRAHGAAPAPRSRARPPDVGRSRSAAAPADAAHDDQLELLAARRSRAATAAPHLGVPRRLDPRSHGAGVLRRERTPPRARRAGVIGGKGSRAGRRRGPTLRATRDDPRVRGGAAPCGRRGRCDAAGACRLLPRVRRPNPCGSVRPRPARRHAPRASRPRETSTRPSSG
jgi:serine/threonine protein kinase